MEPLVTLHMHFHHRTDMAVLASLDGERENAVWLPRSEIEYEPANRPIYLVRCPEWLALEKGLI